MASPLRVEVDGGVLVARLPVPFEIVSWAPHNGGITRADAILNAEVKAKGLKTFEALLAERNLPPETVCLLTAARVADYGAAKEEIGALWVHAVATVGLTNARSVLDDEDVKIGGGRVPHGTINLIIATNALPTSAARIQAVNVAAAARTAALRDAGAKSKKSDRPADLTGTDTFAVASSGEIPEAHCGLHTPTGRCIGRAVHRAVGESLAKHLRSQ